MKIDVLLKELENKTPVVSQFVDRLYGAMMLVDVRPPLVMDVDGTPIPSYIVPNQPIGNAKMDNMVLHNGALFVPCSMNVSVEKFRTTVQNDKTKEDEHGLYQEVYVRYYQLPIFVRLDIEAMSKILSDNSIESVADLLRVYGYDPKRSEKLRHQQTIRAAALKQIRKAEFEKVFARYEKRYPKKISKKLSKNIREMISLGMARVPIYETMSPKISHGSRNFNIMDRVANKVNTRLERLVPKHFDVIVETLADGQRQIYVEQTPPPVIEFLTCNAFKSYAASLKASA